ncbi:MAG: antitoxin [Candidatus Schekmanbacteria bacterium RIFCSPHIGHO2_02_FULL_38_11]|uniref:Antitoxin n=1 Tax=Candidatus Schekmanbacteria bacterium RIFCSPLOWO2_12_FULL_38_15 TaxID=1817883 RepID=A0A1F7SDN1_9BACT|nr:MAG: antitoxin [Candidatus Schekmanbacteria bacterium GWA2_38_9]OGL48258.1 MAG: antitoxin [Candidatus Schekmanbacteria bacterium RIFCSPLOWO2_02_FULL_38_14]OGL51297.1 MAG: antitoxin [Candidatus Schekmanbacteria bacterium RIFCSPLOWO2_12_FULL_38_15]OGL55606.1 MAG: antitoxin [Candidatus Schekmanbacteria bacterium RIFCSPHIGHO2_02_FULL_38_11]
MTEKNLLKRIVINPKIMLGKPVIKGTRLTVEIVVEKIAYGATIQELQRDYPFLKKEDISAALLYAAKSLAHEEVYIA